MRFLDGGCENGGFGDASMLSAAAAAAAAAVDHWNQKKAHWTSQKVFFIHAIQSLFSSFL
jgi:hypothetical protein